MTSPGALLSALMDAGLKAADPQTRLPSFLPKPPKGRAVVVGAGKAAASMAAALEGAWPKDAPLSGLVVTRYGYGLPLARIECALAAHPVPDQAGEIAAKRILAAVQGLSQEDLVLALMSGGGSALLALPASGLSMDEKQRVTKALLASGAAITEINCVRKHLSAIKGGRLGAAAWPAPIVTLAVSDVAGDDPAIIASGPTVADPSTVEEACRILDRYAIAQPTCWSESPKPDDPKLAGADYRLILKPSDMLAAVKAKAQALGLSVLDLGDQVTGEARQIAKAHAGLALATKPGTLILSGGELTVSLKGQGQGGPNGEYLLGLALALQGAASIHALAIDTDGIDGSQGNAGARIGPETLQKAKARGLDAAHCLADNDSYGFFAGLGDLIETGPTRTNLNDLRLVLVL
ncbi:putative hydroxypyruvate reductase [Rhodospirillaceae bacterium LM-1]|nr:putative hydroxypyruvate reductase [Rhodospirillaceae bacterium LM-1]